MFDLDKPLQPSLMFVNKAGAYPGVINRNILHLGRHLAFPTNIGLFWKGMLGTNTLLLKFVNYGRKKVYKIGPRKGVHRGFC